MAMLLAMVTLVTTAGCGGSGEGGNSSAKTDNGNEGTNGAVEIEFWYGLGGILGETMEETIAEFNASQDEVVVKESCSPVMMRLQRCCRQQLPPVKCRHVISEPIRQQRPLRKKALWSIWMIILLQIRTLTRMISLMHSWITAGMMRTCIQSSGMGYYPGSLLPERYV